MSITLVLKPEVKYLNAKSMKNQDSKKNFGITQDTFQKMIDQLQQGNESLFEKIFLTHFDDCMKYIQRKYNANREDAYDVTMEAMIRFRHRLLDGKVAYGNMRFLFTQMAGQMYLKWINKSNKYSTIEAMDWEDEQEESNEEEVQILNGAWSELGEGCQQLLKEFYYQNIPLNQISQQLGKSDVAIRKQKQRCLARLKTLFSKYAYQTVGR